MVLEHSRVFINYLNRAYHLAREDGVVGLGRSVFRKLKPIVEKGEFDPLDVQPVVPSLRKGPYADVRVGVILDEFSMLAWKDEFKLIPINPGNEDSLERLNIDFLLVESAWNGNDGAWQFQLTGSSAPSNNLERLVKRCQGLGIPTVFWNKEDPPHFEDFLSTAKLFDYVFTSDSTKIEDYRNELKHDRVAAMGFAAQPSIHNPIRTDIRNFQTGDVAFAGSYFSHKFPDRREQMKILLSGAEAAEPYMDDGLRIFSRFEGRNERYSFPSPYNEKVVGSLQYERMVSAYKNFKVFLNVNTVVNSPSMCSRRVFEILASGTPIVSTKSLALEREFSRNELMLVDNPAEATNAIRAFVNSSELRDRYVHRAQRRIWRQHTYTNRATQIVKTIDSGIAARTGKEESISIICSTKREAQLDHLFSQVAHQRDVNAELVLILHGLPLDVQTVQQRALAAGVERCLVIDANAKQSLGECLNTAVSVSTGEFIAKFDDDDFYFPDYLLDMYNAWFYTGADLVGKQANYAYLASEDLVLIRYPERELRWTSFVAGPTLFGPRETFEEVPFAHVTNGEDTAFLRELAQRDRKIFSADRFNFVQIRSTDNHTWKEGNLTFLANGKVVSNGKNLEIAQC